MIRRIAVAGVLCALCLAVVTTSLGAASTVRVTAARVVLELKQQRWSDGRIVSGAECVGNGGVATGNAQIRSTHFACLVQAWHRRASISPTLWSRLETAFETGNVAAVYTLLGLKLNATRAQVEAASNRVLGPNTPDAVGAQAVDAAHVTIEPAPISASWFARALTARHAMLVVAVGMERWYADRHTYGGATAARLRTTTPVPSNVRIVVAAANSYCLEATAGPARWSLRGPGGIPALAPCR